jgi:hypothetical protein
MVTELRRAGGCWISGVMESQDDAKCTGGIGASVDWGGNHQGTDAG